MNKFECGKTYVVKKDDLYELHFKCTVVSNHPYPDKYARFMLTKIVAKDIELGKCPIFFSMLDDFYRNIYGNTVNIYVTSPNETGGVREVAFSNYDNYLWIDTNNVIHDC